MSLKLTVLKSMPLAYWKLNDTSGTTSPDLSGNGYTLTHSGTPPLDQGPLNAGGSSIQYATTKYSSATIGRLFYPGQETAAVTIVAWVKVLSPPTARRLIVGRSNAAVSATPAGIEFTVTDSSSNAYTSTYVVTNWDEVKYVVASYGNDKVSVTVNMDQAPAADFTGTFANQTDTWYVGGTGTTSATTLNVADVAVYNFQLSHEEQDAQYEVGTTTMAPSDVTVAQSGVYYGTYDKNTDIFIDYEENATEQFITGTLSDVTVEDNTIFASTAGTPGVRVTNPVDIDGLGAVIDGSRIDWEATAAGVTVEVSLDGVPTWTACTNHAEIPGLSPGTNTDGMVMEFRQTFTTADTTNAPAGLARMRAVLYEDKNIEADHGSLEATVVEPATISERPFLPIESRNASGIQLTRPGALVIPAQADPVTGIGFWVRRDAAYSNTGSLNEYLVNADSAYVRLNSSNTIQASGVTTYLSGAAASLTAANLPLSKFVYVFLVPASPITGPITFNSDTAQGEGGKNTFAHIQLYFQTITTDFILSNYGMQIGSNTIQKIDPVVSSVVDAGFSVYVNTWAAQSSGI